MADELQEARAQKSKLYARHKEVCALIRELRDPGECLLQKKRAKVLWDMYLEACAEVRRLDPETASKRPPAKKQGTSGKALEVMLQNGTLWADLEGRTWSQLAGHTWDGDEPGGQDRQRLRQAAVDSLRALSPRQRETLTLYASGLGVSQIAQRQGVGPSSVSRTLARARKKADRSILLRRQGQRALDARETALGGKRALEAGKTADLRNREALEGVVTAMTHKQLLYFCLYYAEGLSLREIEDLVGTDFTAVSRTIRRAVVKLDRLFGGESVALEHPEALDEAACLAWRELEEHPELVPERAREVLRTGRRPTVARRRDWTPLAEPGTVVLRTEKAVPGKLLELLRAKAEAGKMGLLRWLEGVFLRLRRRMKLKSRS